MYLNAFPNINKDNISLNDSPKDAKSFVNLNSRHSFYKQDSDEEKQTLFLVSFRFSSEGKQMEAMFALSGRYFIHAKEQFLERILFYCSSSGAGEGVAFARERPSCSRVIRPGEQLTHLNSSAPGTSVEFVIHY